ncbi:MAG: hypothetical protein QG592_1857 [Pseudomonadota bacterium]|jgi:hypothetical protein|nr:hypothetical protein [Pseudomonadota bacterium]MDQ5914876.1 hypothetical protein [Pseudomonadota bacterium]MDQ5919037.1 hypothetical protein [Pseudomonadota bacterium]MDQ5960774.1 hypothetical protein [Pseudomonadota bacterium]
MPYVVRNAQGSVVGLIKEAGSFSSEFLAADHPEVSTFIAEAEQLEPGLFSLRADLDMVRVIEDVIDVLIAKNLILLTDLPPVVQQKLLQRRSRRTEHYSGPTMDEVQERGFF